MLDDALIGNERVIDNDVNMDELPNSEGLNRTIVLTVNPNDLAIVRRFGRMLEEFFENL